MKEARPMGWRTHLDMLRSPDGIGAGGSISRAGGTDVPPPPPPPPKIQAFEQKLGGRKHEDTWNRTPNVTGKGAIHVKTFHCKLNDDAIGFLDQQVNEWLDAHPQYEVKLVASNVGDFTGKLGKEAHLIVTVWV
jgi:hypothetical protein